MVESHKLKLERINTLTYEKRDIKECIERLREKSLPEKKLMLGRTNDLFMYEFNGLKFTKTDLDKINYLFDEFINKCISTMEERLKEIDKELEKLL